MVVVVIVLAETSVGQGWQLRDGLLSYQRSDPIPHEFSTSPRFVHLIGSSRLMSVSLRKFGRQMASTNPCRHFLCMRIADHKREAEASISIIDFDSSECRENI